MARRSKTRRRAAQEQANATPAVIKEQANETPAVVKEQANETPAVVKEQENATPAAVKEQANTTPAAVKEQANTTPAAVKEQANTTPAVIKEQANATPAAVKGRPYVPKPVIPLNWPKRILSRPAVPAPSKAAEAVPSKAAVPEPPKAAVPVPAVPEPSKATVAVPSKAAQPVPAVPVPSKRAVPVPAVPLRPKRAVPVPAVPAPPKPVVPALPKQAVPALPKQAVPALPKQAVPALPKQAVPALPQPGVPAFPQPGVPVPSYPAIPTPFKPTMPVPTKLALCPPFPPEFIPQSARQHYVSQNQLTETYREFPSLSNNSQLPSTTQGSMWSAAGSRNISGPIQRNQPTQGSSQQGGQDDLFGPPSSRMQPNQGPFRFGAQPPQVQPNSVDDFPPLNRTSNGEIGSERGGNVMSSIGFGPQNPGSSNQMQSNGGNGLLNALTATSRASDVQSPPAIGTQSGPGQQQRQQQLDGKQKFREDGSGKASEVASPSAEGRAPLGVIGSEGPNGRLAEHQAADVVDPLAGMSEVDKWGIKGLRTLMNTYPDYRSMIIGMDPSSFGLDLSSPELISTQIYSVLDDTPPRPTVNTNKFRLPDCYSVTNVQPIETKIQSFNEETLFWIFYSCPLDAKQQMAAVELHSRNWRWHKKLHIWLTKDEHMTPQILSPNHERGYYIVWDTATWRKDRREFTLHYGDLDTSLGQPPQVLS